MKKPFAVLPLSLGVIATGNQRANRPAAHLGEFGAIGMIWQSNGNGNLWARGDLGAVKPIDFASMIWANAQPGTTIRLRLGATQAAVDGVAAYDSGALPFISPAITRDDGLYSSHLELDGVVNARWWRIDIGGHAGDFSAAKLVLGRRILSASYPNPGWSFGADDLGEHDITRWGVVDEADGVILRTLAFKLGWVTTADFETKWRPLLERGRRQITLWCFDPEASAYRQARTYLGFTGPNPATGGVGVDKYEMDLEVRSLI